MNVDYSIRFCARSLVALILGFNFHIFVLNVVILRQVRLWKAAECVTLCETDRTAQSPREVSHMNMPAGLTMSSEIAHGSLTFCACAREDDIACFCNAQLSLFS